MTARPTRLRRCSRSSPRSRSSGIPGTWAMGRACETAFRSRHRAGLRRAGHARLRRPARAFADPRARRPAGRRRYRLRQPLPARSSTRIRHLPRSGGGSTSRSRAGSTSAWPEPDRCVLRLQGLPAVGTRAFRHHRQRLRHAASGLGAGRPARLCRSSRCPVPLIYLDEERAFGGSLDDSAYRLNHYRQVFQDALRTAGLEVAGGCRG